MTEKFYRFAGLEFAIAMPADMMYNDPFRLTPFAVDAVSAPHIFAFDRTEELPDPCSPWTARTSNCWTCTDADRTVRYIGVTGENWKKAHTCVVDAGKNHQVLVRKAIFPGRINSATVLETLNLEHLVAQNNGVILHCSYISWEGKAILFTAPSQTGKSTQAELWKKYRGAEIINGDRAVIRVTGEGILVEGLPFCGSSAYCENRTLPLTAIVYLEQAPVTTVRKLRGYEVFARLWEGIISVAWNKKDIERASGTLEKIACTVPVYHMPCTPDKQAVEALEMTLRKQRNL